jgi:hypothetical protein
LQAARVLARSMTGKSVISLCVEDGEDVVGLPKTLGDFLSGLLGYVGKGGAVTLVPRGSQLSTLLSCTTLSPKLDRGRILPYRARVRDCTTCTLKHVVPARRPARVRAISTSPSVTAFAPWRRQGQSGPHATNAKGRNGLCPPQTHPQARPLAAPGPRPAPIQVLIVHCGTLFDRGKAACLSSIPE